MTIDELIKALYQDTNNTPQPDLALLESNLFDTDRPHWFSRVVTGFGAWLSSWLMIGFFVASTFWLSTESYSIIGFVFMVGATLLQHKQASKKQQSSFIDQFALSTALAGQGLIITGIIQNFSGNDFVAGLCMVVFINSIMVFLYPDKTHRFLSMCFITVALTGLIYKYEQQQLLALLTAFYTLLGCVCAVAQDQVSQAKWYRLFTPVCAGLFASALGLCVLSAIYVLPEIVDDFNFYPNPWVATVSATVLLSGYLWRILHLSASVTSSVEHAHFASHDEQLTLMGKSVLLVIISLLGLLTLSAPGIVLSALVITIGYFHNSKGYLALGLVGYLLFFSFYLYGIGISMLAKSITLTSAGVLLLVAASWLARTRHQLINASASEVNDVSPH
jgi:uncharacterized membrane protein